MAKQDFEKLVKTKLKQAAEKLEAKAISTELDDSIYKLIDTTLTEKEKLRESEQVTSGDTKSIGHKSRYLWPALAASFLLVASISFLNRNSPEKVPASGLSSLVTTSQALESNLASTISNQDSVAMMSLNSEIEAIDKVLASLYQQNSSDDLKKQYWNKRIKTLESIQLLVSLNNQNYQRI